MRSHIVELRPIPGGTFAGDDYYPALVPFEKYVQARPDPLTRYHTRLVFNVAYSDRDLISDFSQPNIAVAVCKRHYPTSAQPPVYICMTSRYFEACYAEPCDDAMHWPPDERGGGLFGAGLSCDGPEGSPIRMSEISYGSEMFKWEIPRADLAVIWNEAHKPCLCSPDAAAAGK